MTNSNCKTFDEADSFGSLLNFKWNRKKNTTLDLDVYSCVFLVDNSIINNHQCFYKIILLKNKNQLNVFQIVKLNIIYYVCWYVVKNIIPMINCEFCTNSLFHNSTDHDYCLPETFTNFVALKNNGGLVLQKVFWILLSIKDSLTIFS